MSNFVKKIFIKTVGHLWHSLSMQKKTRLILAFHEIDSNGNKYAVSQKRFESIVKKLMKEYVFVSLETLLSSQTKKNLATITFDDGYESVLKIVPFLNLHKIPATIFILTNPKRVNRKELDANSNFLKESEIKKLLSIGWTLGSHGETHTDFSALATESLEQEIRDSKYKLEKMYGVEVKYFAYPKGVVDTNIATLVKRNGYDAGFSTYPAPVAKGTNRFALPRFVMEKTDIFGPLPYAFVTPVQKLRNFKKYEN